jgi:hypothetical protein
MTPTYTLVPAAAGASRLYLGTSSAALIAEHRSWLDEAYHERAAETPGVLQLLRADGTVVRTVSGWALGGPTGDAEAAWIEETGEEYRYRVARIAGPGAALAPPDDYWAIAGAVGHPAAPLGAVVLWRPAKGTSPRDPAGRRDELWIAAIDRAAGTIVKTRELALTLPRNRAEGVLLGGSAQDPILLLIGLPDPGGPGAYRALGLHLATLEPAWEASLDVAAIELGRASAPPPGTSSPPPPAAPLTGDALRTLYASMATPLGDGSGWLFAHGGLIRDVLVVDLALAISADGKPRWLGELHLSATDKLCPISGQPGALLFGTAGARNDLHFVSLDAVWPAEQRVQTLADARTKVAGRALGDAPELLPMSAAMQGGTLYVAPPIGGTGIGAESDDVRGKQTTPVTWHQPDRPRVQARQRWLDDRARP